MLAHFILATLSGAVAPVPEGARFDDWMVACDNVRRCEAVASDYAGRETDWTLHVTRGADSYASPQVEAFRAFDDPMAVAGIRIDGRNASFGFDDNGGLVGDPTAFLHAVARARTAELIGADGSVVGVLPLDGASAALRWIDAQQQRAGTVTAVVARGARPASAVPAPPPLPRIAQPSLSDAPPQSLTAADLAEIKLSGDCDGDVPPAADVATYRLDAAHTVGIVGCFLGAYQAAFVVVVIDEHGHWTPAPIERAEPLPEGLDPRWQSQLTTAGYQGDTRLLTMWAKGRGLGDCGSSASWAWDGAMFRLASYRALDECMGKPPGNWLLRWQTANDPLGDGE